MEADELVERDDVSTIGVEVVVVDVVVRVVDVVVRVVTVCLGEADDVTVEEVRGVTVA